MEPDIQQAIHTVKGALNDLNKVEFSSQVAILQLGAACKRGGKNWKESQQIAEIFQLTPILRVHFKRGYEMATGKTAAIQLKDYPELKSAVLRLTSIQKEWREVNFRYSVAITGVVSACGKAGINWQQTLLILDQVAGSLNSAQMHDAKAAYERGLSNRVRDYELKVAKGIHMTSTRTAAKAPPMMKWTERGDQFFMDVKYADRGQHVWGISPKGEEWVAEVQIPEEDGTQNYQCKKTFESAEDAKTFAWRFINSPIGDEKLAKVLGTQFKQISVGKAVVKPKNPTTTTTKALREFKASLKEASSTQTLSDRLEEVYTKFAQDTQMEIRKHLRDLSVRVDPRVSLGWDTFPNGTRYMTVDMINSKGKKAKFGVAPTDPISTAGKILFYHGGYSLKVASGGDAMEAMDRVFTLLKAGKLKEAQKEVLQIEKEGNSQLPSSIYEKVLKAAIHGKALLPEYATFCKRAYGAKVYERIAV